MLACRNLTKTYGSGPLTETALADVSLSFEAGESYVLLGPSGSGKTTLLSMLGCLLSPTGGEVLIDGRVVDFEDPAQLGELRRTHIGFVFQHAQLLPFLTVAENLAVIAENGVHKRGQDLRIRTEQLLERLGVGKYAHRKPRELSGGQRQRVSVARALLHRPKIILADEPTAALDWDNGQAVMQLLIEQAHSEGALVLTVTHDRRLVKLFGHVIRFESGHAMQSESEEQLGL